MKTLVFLIIFITPVTLAEHFKTIDGKEYKNVTVSRVESDGIVLRTKSGISKVYFSELPKEVQQRFHYDAAISGVSIGNDNSGRVSLDGEISTRKAEMQKWYQEAANHQKELDKINEKQEIALNRRPFPDLSEVDGLHRQWSALVKEIQLDRDKAAEVANQLYPVVEQQLVLLQQQSRQARTEAERNLQQYQTNAVAPTESEDWDREIEKWDAEVNRLSLALSANDAQYRELFERRSGVDWKLVEQQLEDCRFQRGILEKMEVAAQKAKTAVEDSLHAQQQQLAMQQQKATEEEAEKDRQEHAEQQQLAMQQQKATEEEAEKDRQADKLPKLPTELPSQSTSGAGYRKAISKGKIVLLSIGGLAGLLLVVAISIQPLKIRAIFAFVLLPALALAAGYRNVGHFFQNFWHGSLASQNLRQQGISTSAKHVQTGQAGKKSKVRFSFWTGKEKSPLETATSDPAGLDNKKIILLCIIGGLASLLLSVAISSQPPKIRAIFAVVLFLVVLAVAAGYRKSVDKKKFVLLPILGIASLLLVGLIYLAIQVNRPVEDRLAARIQTELDTNKQKIFDSLHPIGTAKTITVHDVTIDAWKHDQRTRNIADVRQLTVRYTLYWTSWFHDDGFTKVSQTYDAESGRYMPPQIIETNGITNETMGNIGVMIIGNVLQYEAQKAGSEQATRDYLNNQ